MENNLNFKQFMTNAASWYSGDNTIGPDLEAGMAKLTMSTPTTSTRNPVEVFSVEKKGKTYEILADGNISWGCPASQYNHLMQIGKAPQKGDKITLEFFRDGSIKTFNIVQKKERGLAN